MNAQSASRVRCLYQPTLLCGRYKDDPRRHTLTPGTNTKRLVAAPYQSCITPLIVFKFDQLTLVLLNYLSFGPMHRQAQPYTFIQCFPVLPWHGLCVRLAVPPHVVGEPYDELFLQWIPATGVRQRSRILHRPRHCPEYLSNKHQHHLVGVATRKASNELLADQ